nr:MAG TPA: hypothetical protein [Caudoviricetes sp.]
MGRPAGYFFFAVSDKFARTKKERRGNRLSA